MTLYRRLLSYCIIFAISVTLSGCSRLVPTWMKTCKNNYNSNYQGSYKIGIPYKIKNVKYHPKKEPYYNKTGLASWYGDRFHCKKTANGQFFNKHELTAAHRTLPLPSIVRVTNLENNRSVVVIVNDRGPFVPGSSRIIDLSERAAISLGMKHKGLAKVQVKHLPHKTNQLLSDLNLHEHIDHRHHKPHERVKLASKPKSISPKKQFVKATKKKPSPTFKSRISIDVGEYKNKQKALRAVKNLSKYGYVKLSQINKSGSKLYQVSFSGASRSKKQSQRILEKIIKLGHKHAKFSNHWE